MAESTVVILNGAGSVGKTSTARALQLLTSAPFLHSSMDAFIDMLPRHLLGHPDGMVFEPVMYAGHRLIKIHTGPAMERAMDGMRHAVAAMAESGNNLIVDDVMLGKGEAAACRHLLSAHRLIVVGLSAPLNVLEARERARGDREIGLARGQVDHVHNGVTYDLEIDTASMDAEAAAELIKRRFDL